MTPIDHPMTPGSTPRFLPTAVVVAMVALVGCSETSEVGDKADIPASSGSVYPSGPTDSAAAPGEGDGASNPAETDASVASPQGDGEGASPDGSGVVDSAPGPQEGDAPAAHPDAPEQGGACDTGASEPCYEGAVETSGVGVCAPGSRSCADGQWGPCVGQVLPSLEAVGGADDVCTNGLDDDCDGLIDEDLDDDMDGFGSCSLDCCDGVEQGCPSAMASLVSPAAFDLPNNGIDDDCDGVVDGGDSTACSQETLSADVTAQALVEAMDLCRFVDEGGQGWGVLEASLSLADGSGQPADIQLGVTESFGQLLAPIANQTMAVLSSGIARGVGDEGFENDNTHNAKTKSAPPESYLAVHGQLQAAEGCPTGSNTVRDSVRLRVRLRAPVNVHGLRFSFRFFSHEFPNYVCTQYNDFFLVLMEGQSPALPEDGNVSFDASGNPISVNNAFFTTCDPLDCYDNSYVTQLGPDSNQDGCVDILTCNPETNLCEGPLGACPDGVDDLQAFTTDLSFAGGTSWLMTEVPVVPGEALTLDFLIWDTSDAALDSLVLLDAFQWIYQSGIGLSTRR